MASIQKFLFETSFDDGRRLAAEPDSSADTEAEAEPEPPPEPTFTLSELEASLERARAEAYGRGFAEGTAAGREQAEVEAERTLAAALAAVDAALRDLITAELAGRAARREGTARMTLAMVRKLIPAYLTRFGSEEIEWAVTTFLQDLVEEPKLIFRVHERWLETLRSRIQDMADRHGFAGHVSVLSDPRLGEFEVKADWGDGGAERDPIGMWQEIERIAGNVLAELPGGPAEVRAGRDRMAGLGATAGAPH